MCVPPPSYCVPILSTRQKAHLDLVGWKVGLLHRALLVNGGLPPVSRATLPPPPPSVLSLSPSLLLSLSLRLDLHMSSLPQTAQLSKYLKLCKLIIRPSTSCLLIYKQREGGEREREWPKSRGETRTHTLLARVAALRTGSTDTGAANH